MSSPKGSVIEKSFSASSSRLGPTRGIILSFSFLSKPVNLCRGFTDLRMKCYARRIKHNYLCVFSARLSTECFPPSTAFVSSLSGISFLCSFPITFSRLIRRASCSSAREYSPLSNQYANAFGRGSWEKSGDVQIRCQRVAMQERIIRGASTR